MNPLKNTWVGLRSCKFADNVGVTEHRLRLLKCTGTIAPLRNLQGIGFFLAQMMQIQQLCGRSRGSD
ncbi:hypothetical protein BCR12_10290 [Limnothrix sp. P13C2]|nr:hypothetical protein BCR12_10290 [Limnothrix sp. P13C2]